MADMSIVPSSDRFVTPERSVMISPQTAMMSGEACKTMDARTAINWLSFISHLRVPWA